MRNNLNPHKNFLCLSFIVQNDYFYYKIKAQFSFFLTFIFLFSAAGSPITLEEELGAEDSAIPDLEQSGGEEYEEVVYERRVKLEGDGSTSRQHRRVSESGSNVWQSVSMDKSTSSHESDLGNASLSEPLGLHKLLFSSLHDKPDAPVCEKLEMLFSLFPITEDAFPPPGTVEEKQCVDMVTELVSNWSNILATLISIKHPSFNVGASTLLVNHLKVHVTSRLSGQPSHSFGDSLKLLFQIARWVMVQNPPESSHLDDVGADVDAGSEGSNFTIPYLPLNTITELCLDLPTIYERLSRHSVSTAEAAQENNWPSFAFDRLFKMLSTGMPAMNFRRLRERLYLQLSSHLPPHRYFLNEDARFLHNAVLAASHHILALLTHASSMRDDISLADITLLCIDLLFRVKLRFLLGLQREVGGSNILELARKLLFQRNQALLDPDVHCHETLDLLSTVWERPNTSDEPLPAGHHFGGLSCSRNVLT